jgi:hypothetical protein
LYPEGVQKYLGDGQSMYPSVRTGTAIGAVVVYCGKESQHVPEKPDIAGKQKNASNNNFFIPLFRESKSIVE